MKAKVLLAAVEATGEALICVQEAVNADPSDSQLAADLKETTARHALRQGGYKYILAPTPELYDLTADPAESRDLEGPKVPQQVELLKKALASR